MNNDPITVSHRGQFAERSSGLPIGYYSRSDRARDVFVRYRWLAIVALLIALALAWYTRSPLPNL